MNEHRVSQDNPFSSEALRHAFSPETFRRQGHRLVDRLADYLIQAMRGGDFPVLPWAEPADTAAAWPSAFPEEGAGEFHELLDRVLSAANHLHHPCYMGHQVPGPLPIAALCDLVSSLLNNSTAVYEMSTSAAGMERAVIQWMARQLGFGAEADGMLTSGGSLGNLTALLAARQVRGSDGDPRPPAVLVSSQAHYSLLRAVRILGFGSDGCEPVAVDADYRIRPEALVEALRRAESRGRRVIAVAANACSTATGAYDPVLALADFCGAQGLWLHVDAAHGGAACLSEKYRFLLEGIQYADSVVWDAHKMMLMPSLVTGVLFKDGRHAYAAFDDKASYLYERASEEEWYNFGHRTLECTKPLSCLKVYIALQCFGTRLFGDYVTGTYDLARRFAVLLDQARDFECAARPQSNIVCFRYTPPGVSDLDMFQSALRKRLIAEGGFYIVQTQLPTGLHLRTTLINPLTQEAHLVQLMDRIRAIGSEIAMG